MKKILYYLFSGCILFSACNKDSQPPTPATTAETVTYEVITSTGDWFGEYNDNNGQRTYSKSTAQTPVLKSGWKYTFKPGTHPFTMFINANSSCICFGTPTSPDVTINFYVNDKLVKTATNNWAKGVTEVSYNIP